MTMQMKRQRLGSYWVSTLHHCSTLQRLNRLNHQNYPREVAEMALAHTIDNKVEAAYRRGDLLEARLARGAARLPRGLRHRRADGQGVPDARPQGPDGAAMVALSARGLTRQAIKPLGDGPLALVGGIGRQPRCERRRDDGR